MIRARRQHMDEEVRASYTELLFDLVFVLVVTQLSALLLHDPSLRGALKMLFLLLLAWWAWMYTTWTTNWFDPETLPMRFVLLVGMVAAMLGAISVPEAFGERAVLLVVGFVALQVVRNTFVLFATEADDRLYLPLVRLWRWNAAISVLWVVGAFLDGHARIAVWLVALVLDYLGPFAGHWSPGLGRSAAIDWELIPSHFAERLHLFVMIALGESIVATGSIASHRALTPLRLVALLAALLITVALWWLYFDYHADRAREELAAAGDERGRLGRDLSYVHVPIIAGIIVVAVGNELVVASPRSELPGHELVLLGAGPALYLLGGLALKLRVLGVVATQRLIAAALVCGTALLGTAVPALAVWGLVLAILVALAALETQARFREMMQVAV